MKKNILKFLFSIAILHVFFISKAQTTKGKIYLKIESLIKQMMLQEKVNMIHASSSFTSGGVPRLGIPELKMSDGPHGVRPEFGRDWTPDVNVYDSGTALPTGNCLAATWNPALGFAFGTVLG